MNRKLKRTIEWVASNISVDREEPLVECVAYAFDADVALVKAAVDATRAEAEKKAALARLEKGGGS